MTGPKRVSERQLAANRSTGPRTSAGRGDRRPHRLRRGAFGPPATRVVVEG